MKYDYFRYSGYATFLMSNSCKKGFVILTTRMLMCYRGLKIPLTVLRITNSDSRVTTLSAANIVQDIPKKENHHYNRGFIQDHTISQTYKDCLNHKDSLMDFAWS